MVPRSLLVALLLCGPTAATAGGQNAQQEIKLRIEAMRETGSLQIAGLTLRSSEVLAAVYERRAFVPLWSDTARRAALISALESVVTDGLAPEWYQTRVLREMRRAADDAAERARADLLHTLALIEVAADLRFGRVDAVTLRRRRESDLTNEQRLRIIEVAALPPAEALQRMRPDHYAYRGMTAALGELLRANATGGWTDVPNLLMKYGTSDSAVLLLRRRLIEEGDLPRGGATDIVFDSAVLVAVQSWQHRHGLNPDGVVGPATLREMAVPLGDRIRQLQINLERARWVLHDLADTFIAVNAAAALVYYVRDGVVLFESRAIVGRTYTRTPMFSAQLRYLDLNPTWTVPPGIVSEVLAAVRRNPGWLSTQNMRVVDHAGRLLNPASINFARYSGSTFPYVFRQDPGPLNPLGAIKFVFPNRYNVYLHDTPARELFEREERLFSHGCIRVQNPLRLAELVLNDGAWTADSMRTAIATGRTRTITLARPIPVLVLYWTAAADLHGELHFYRDVYGRDEPLLRALDPS